MIFVSGKKIGNVKDKDYRIIQDIYNEVEVFDDKYKHKFIFTQNKDKGIQVNMIPYDGSLK